MNRRSFLTLLGLGPAAALLPADAGAKFARGGFVSVSSRGVFGEAAIFRPGETIFPRMVMPESPLVARPGEDIVIHVGGRPACRGWFSPLLD